MQHDHLEAPDQDPEYRRLHDEHRHDRAALNHRHEEIGAMAAEKPVNQQDVAGRRNRKEFGDAFDEAKNDCCEPIGHRVFRREFCALGKKQIGFLASAATKNFLALFFLETLVELFICSYPAAELKPLWISSLIARIVTRSFRWILPPRW